MSILKATLEYYGERVVMVFKTLDEEIIQFRVAEQTFSIGGSNDNSDY